MDNLKFIGKKGGGEFGKTVCLVLMFIFLIGVALGGGI